jgi:RNA polymerase sigma-70 factor, ECF subfamily
VPGLSGIVQFPVAVGRTPVQAAERKENGEEALIRRVKARDELAFRQILDRYQSKVFSIICRILRNRNDAEDLAQQVFTKIYFSIRSFDSRSSLLTWIYRITVNECYRYLRRKQARKLVYESDFSAEDIQRLEGCAEDQTAPTERQLLERDLVAKLLAKVSEEARILILLKEVEGHSVEELAAMTGLNENAIKVKLFRTRRKLVKAARCLGMVYMFRPNLRQTSKGGDCVIRFHVCAVSPPQRRQLGSVNP